MLPIWNPPKYKDFNRLQVKEWKNIYRVNPKQTHNTWGRVGSEFSLRASDHPSQVT